MEKTEGLITSEEAVRMVMKEWRCSRKKAEKVVKRYKAECPDELVYGPWPDEKMN